MRYRKAINLKQRIRGRPREKPEAQKTHSLNFSLKRHKRSLLLYSTIEERGIQFYG